MHTEKTNKKHEKFSEKFFSKKFQKKKSNIFIFFLSFLLGRVWESDLDLSETFCETYAILIKTNKK